MLPLAVETLQAHGARLEKERQRKMAGGIVDLNSRRIKVSRNGPCPCGSGKKYKKILRNELKAFAANSS
ncbi:SEC-C metal-binding domain-containing protein [Dissulfurispira sp.]|uniref:SEC-C metal-binding domain-containing protein n=1 Tax=Dissulfurispira sp. TaxID=2817609 RepID=UPI002FDB91A5